MSSAFPSQPLRGARKPAGENFKFSEKRNSIYTVSSTLSDFFGQGGLVIAACVILFFGGVLAYDAYVDLRVARLRDLIEILEGDIVRLEPGVDCRTEDVHLVCELRYGDAVKLRPVSLHYTQKKIAAQGKSSCRTTNLRFTIISRVYGPHVVPSVIVFLPFSFQYN